jgi:hypothetical protein
MIDQIDWPALANQLGLLRSGSPHDPGARYESSGSDPARRALEILIGEPAIRASVDYYITYAPGSELARSVLSLLHPWSAMAYCYEIWRSSSPIEDRRRAIELLRVVADRRALGWVGEFLEDPDDGIQEWGAGVLDQLLWSNLVTEEEAEPLLANAEKHPNPQVRRRAEFIRGYLRARAQPGDSEESPT